MFKQIANKYSFSKRLLFLEIKFNESYLFIYTEINVEQMILLQSHTRSIVSEQHECPRREY